MRKQIQNVIKQYIREEMLKTRSELKITQEEMAQRLKISTRAYTDIEGGKYCCSLFTLLTYLFELCTDPRKFLNGLRDILDQKKPDAA